MFEFYLFFRELRDCGVLICCKKRGTSPFGFPSVFAGSFSGFPHQIFSRFFLSSATNYSASTRLFLSYLTSRLPDSLSCMGFVTIQKIRNLRWVLCYCIHVCFSISKLIVIRCNYRIIGSYNFFSVHIVFCVRSQCIKQSNNYYFFIICFNFSFAYENPSICIRSLCNCEIRRFHSFNFFVESNFDCFAVNSTNLNFSCELTENSSGIGIARFFD